MKISEVAKNLFEKLEQCRQNEDNYDYKEHSVEIIQSLLDSETKRFSDQLIETTAEVLACRKAMQSDDAVICDLECENATLKRRNAAIDSETRELREALKEARQAAWDATTSDDFEAKTIYAGKAARIIDAALKKAGDSALKGKV